MEITKQKLLLVKEKSFEYNKKITSTLDVISFIREVLEIQNESQEVVYVLTLNTKNEIISFLEIARGGLNMCNLSIPQLFKSILLSNSNKFILIHNHPSGDPAPSKNDIDITKDILKASKILKVDFLDHLVIGDSKYQSIMKELKR